MRSAPHVDLSTGEALRLHVWAEGPATPPRLALRARIVLLAARDLTNQAIAEEAGVHPETAALWRQRFALNRLEGIRTHAPRSGMRRLLNGATVTAIVDAARGPSGPDGKCWTTRSLAGRMNVSHMAVHRAWRSHGIVPAAGKVPGGEKRPLRRIQALELCGVFLRAPTGVIVFGESMHFEPIGTETTSSSGSAEGEAGPREPPSACWGELHRQLLEWRTGARSSGPTPSPVQDLLVFLRSVEQQNPGPGPLHLFCHRLPETGRSRIDRWLGTHPRYRPPALPSRLGWIEAAWRWVESWPSEANRSLHLDGAAPCADALSISMRRGPPTPGPFVWTAEYDSLRGAVLVRPRTFHASSGPASREVRHSSPS